MKITIIGCGLIGGSLALALKRRRPEHFVVCLDLPERIPAILDAYVADAAGSIDDFAAYIPESDIVVVATPVQFMPDTLSAINPFLKKNAIVTDVGSTKSKIMAEAHALMPPGVHFIGGHPMAGAERSGVEAADPLLFSDRVYALCPYQDTPPDAFLTLLELVEGLGAVPVTIDPEEHDRILAMVSHLPHFIAVALMHAAMTDDAEHGMLEKMAGRSFLDITRLAASSYVMWKGVMKTNAEAIREALESFNRSLAFIIKEMMEPSAEEAWEQAAKMRWTMTPDSRLRFRKQDLRMVIDQHDKQLMSVLAKRFDAVRKIGKLKAHQSVPVVDADREKRMMVERRDWGKSLGLPEDMTGELFAVILKHSSRLQEPSGH
ncbi:MAG: prephenate dehydrogenase/arogenate dehydrogenase family protein [Acidobacteria bacterium]|nr:prephenate dehydrogenase/arogenate dehydrogenase family protein [Acidobacteriota bacterium]